MFEVKREKKFVETPGQ